MSRLNNLPAPQKVWKSLSAKQQINLVRRIVQARHKSLRQKYPNVVSVGAGFRTKGPKKRVLRKVCIRFLVTTKWKRPRANGVPPFLYAVVVTRGAKKRCAIPTDVAKLGAQRATASSDLGKGIAVRTSGGAALGGAVCALVKDLDLPDRFYLLGCHHVMTGSLEVSGCGPDFACSVVRAEDSRPIGPTVAWSELTPATGFSIDAALVKVHDKSAVSSRIRGVEPQRVAPEGVHPDVFSIITPRKVLMAKFVGEHWDMVLKYQCGAKVIVERVYECHAATEPGDSGSPLIDGDESLFGMHFFETDEGLALAIPAFQLFDESLFSKRLGLVKGHAPKG